MISGAVVAIASGVTASTISGVILAKIWARAVSRISFLLLSAGIGCPAA